MSYGDDITLIKDGIAGEKIIRDYFINKGMHFFQVDLMVKGKSDAWYVVEVKHQEMYESPPFDGHGLPKWQIEARLEFQTKFNIRALLFVVDKTTQIVYGQFIDTLMSSEKYQTKGLKPRVIFPLTSFIIIKP